MPTNSKNPGNSKGASKVKTRSIPTHHDLPEERRMKMVELLNAQLADTFDLFSQTKQAHWNVKGKDFYQLHLLYDELAGELLEFVDLIAERATTLGGVATGTARMAASSTRLAEIPDGPLGSMESVRILVVRYSDLAQTTRQALDIAEDEGDQDTMDLFTEVSRGLDKALWFLEAHIQEAE
jgi:starvation-inducible DNA-binding protein